jgi:hypothetical protein
VKSCPNEGDWIHNRFFENSVAKPDPITCSCGRPAYYRVSGKGFCRGHRAEAQVAEARRIGSYRKASA